MSKIKKDYCKKYKTSRILKRCSYFFIKAEKEHLVSAVLRRIRKSGHRSKNKNK